MSIWRSIFSQNIIYLFKASCYCFELKKKKFICHNCDLFQYILHLQRKCEVQRYPRGLVIPLTTLKILFAYLMAFWLQSLNIMQLVTDRKSTIDDLFKMDFRYPTSFFSRSLGIIEQLRDNSVTSFNAIYHFYLISKIELTYHYFSRQFNNSCKLTLDVTSQYILISQS